ncbi:MAG: hypothetical protein WA431_05290 [Candidatus Cybelea sp.]
MRDVVEVVAIVAAGIWAFYVFAYENRIKPSLADPNVDVSAAMRKLSERNGLIGVGLDVQFHNVGTVRAHFLGLAVNVYGQRIVGSASKNAPKAGRLGYEYAGFYRAAPAVPVYSIAFITHLGDPKSLEDLPIDPGSTVKYERTFYVPQGRFDLLTLGIDAPYTKFEASPVPSRLQVSSQGAARILTPTSGVWQFNLKPVTALDIR